MTPERYHQVIRLFHEAVDREHRADFLRQACGDDDSLRLEVERMLAAHDQAGSFLDAPAVAALAHSLIDKQGGQQSGEQDSALVGCTIGHYQVLGKLGKGGMGEVLLAQDTILRRRVALKLLPTEFISDRDRVRRFEQEARAASALNHPNIITIHEIGQASIETRNLHFIAEEFVDGQTLRHRIQQSDVPLLDALEVAAQAASALEAAHAAGIVHRDIKPENIMLRPDGFIKILDFGLAKLTEQAPVPADFDLESPTITRTTPGTILGTAAYMSPEQARGLDVDARSDIWSLGVLLYEMLTRQKPFKGITSTDVIVSILEREPPPLNQSLPKALPELERIVMKALAKNRNQRYQTAKDLGIDLKNLKSRLEFDAELARVSKPELTSEATGATTRMQLQTSEHIARKTVLPRIAPTGGKLALPRPLIVAVILLSVAAIGYFGWAWLRPNASTRVEAPERRMTYSFTVQRMRDGKQVEEPFEFTGQEVFENGWKFRLDFTSPQPGFLYLLNEALVAKGAIGYYVLFPFPTISGGSSRVAPDELIRTGWYVVHESQGTEKLVMVWAAQPISELEAVKGVVNPNDKGLISDPAQLNAVREFFSKYAQSKPEAETDKIKKQTSVRGPGNVLVHLVELKQR